MVLQAHRPVPIWGRAAPGERVSVDFAGQSHATRADAEGRWRVTLAALDYAEKHLGQTLVVRGADELRIEDVLIGEVWLAVAPPDLSSWVDDRVGPAGPENVLRAGAGLNLRPLPHLRVWHGVNRNRAWQPASPEAVAAISATAYPFARHLAAHLDVPIGLIDLSAASTSVLAYLPWHDVNGTTPEGAIAGSDAFRQREHLYRTTVHPLAPFAVRGVVWTQGEADLPHVENYADWLTALIARWRADFEQLELPFLIAQAPGAPRGEAWLELRRAQARVGSDVLGASTVLTIDLGDCHGGPNSRLYEIGERLGRLARARVYDEVLPDVNVPVLARVEVQPGRVLAQFAHVAGGLVVSGRELQDFELLNEAGESFPARAELVPPLTVAVMIPDGLAPTVLRYGWKDCFVPTLRNAYGQPVAPFRATFESSNDLDPQRWERTIGVFTQQDRLRLPPADGVLFIGSSSIRGWYSAARDFPGLNVINRGFGGSLASDAVYYFEEIVRPYRPRTIVFYAGENDISAGRSSDDVVAAFAAFCEKVHAALPATRVLFLAIKPSLSRWHLWPVMSEGNARIAEYCQMDPRRVFVDTASPLLDASGRVRPELFYDDALHLNADGYRVWTSVLDAALRR
jgi:lysophospholipase L1-like esterase